MAGADFGAACYLNVNWGVLNDYRPAGEAQD
jgi:hypothetical protein